jgi:hypothetical protein
MLTELPERIWELTEIRDLETFEQDLYRLPERLFELSKLERLKISTADLESIPASIDKLKNLREHCIYCAGLDQPGFRPKPKEEISSSNIYVHDVILMRRAKQVLYIREYRR